MRTWNLQWTDPLYTLLSADARLGGVDFCDDQMWQWGIGGDPQALELRTTYGLRARSMRLFPFFSAEGRLVSDPADFAEAIRVQQLFPNYLRCGFAPFAGLEVTLEVWVPDSHTLSGRIRVRNRGAGTRRLELGWGAQLVPVEGEQLHPYTLDGIQVLCGRTANLAPLVFFTGGLTVVASPVPAFMAEVSLLPAEERTFRWVQVALADAEAGLAHARQVAARPWEAEIARLECLHAADVEIYTGDPALDATLYLTQVAALALLHRYSDGTLAAPFFVSRRHPDLGFSLVGDGSDYPPAWRGSTPLAAWHLAQTVLLPAPHLVAGWVENFLQHALPDGAVDMQPGPAGQRSHVLALPVLISLAGEVYRRTRDRAWLEKVFPPLTAFFHHWFHPHHDSDGDGFPEWEHPLQLETDLHPAFSPWESWTQGLNVQVVEDPALAAMLIHAAHTLLQFAQELEASAPRAALQAIIENLHTALQLNWQDGKGYRPWDRDTHRSPTGQLLGVFRGPTALELGARWETPQRLVLHLTNPDRAPLPVQVFIQGLAAGGQQRVERLTLSAAQWAQGKATLTSDQTYLAVEHISFQGLPAEGSVVVSTADLDFDCLSHFLPLWAGVPSSAQAARLQALLTDPDGYEQPYGLPFCPRPPVPEAEAACLRVWWPWVGLVLQGLWRYGYRHLAADLYLRALRGTAQVLRQEHTFRQAIHALTGQGWGAPGALTGLPPVLLFLRLAGLEVLSPWEVHVLERNPFPWPLTIRWRGLEVQHTDQETRITFPNGKQVLLPEVGVRVLGRTPGG